jgi:hypothetical protein
MTHTQEKIHDTEEVLQESTALTEQPDEPVEARFLDRVIAFSLVIWPFSYLISRSQELLQPILPRMLANLSVLVGLIGFLLVVGWLSKRVYRIRQRL